MVLEDMADDKANTEALTERAREFVNHLKAKDVVAATSMFNDKMKQSLPGNALAQLWEGLEQQAGPLKDLTGTVKHTQEQGFDCVYLEGAFEKAPLFVKVVFEGGKNVAGLQFVPQAP